MGKYADRVFVTGLGAVSAAGVGADVLWDACLESRSFATGVPARWERYYNSSSRVWAPLVEPDYRSFGIRRSEELLLSRPALLGIVSTEIASDSAGLVRATNSSPGGGYAFTDVAPERVGVFVGTGLGGAKSPFDNYAAHLLAGMKVALKELRDERPDDLLIQELTDFLGAHPRVNPMVICQTMPNALAANIALRFGAQAVAETFCAACASGTVAIGKAYRALLGGEVDIALAGGIEHLSDRAGGVFMGFDRLQTLASPFTGVGTENRPFDADRSGFLFSEGGAGMAVLETGASVKRRGAEKQIIAELVGFGQSNDAFSIAAISPQHNTFTQMLRAALVDAALTPDSIDYINTHGTGTILNDATEASFIENTFGDKPFLNSTKSILGHSIGAAGALEFVVTALSLKHQTVHASRNLRKPIANLNFALETLEAPLTYALSHNFGFGGHNAALVLKHYDGALG